MWNYFCDYLGSFGLNYLANSLEILWWLCESIWWFICQFFWQLFCNYLAIKWWLLGTVWQIYQGYLSIILFSNYLWLFGGYQYSGTFGESLRSFWDYFEDSLVIIWDWWLFEIMCWTLIFWAIIWYYLKDYFGVFGGLFVWKIPLDWIFTIQQFTNFLKNLNKVHLFKWKKKKQWKIQKHSAF